MIPKVHDPARAQRIAQAVRMWHGGKRPRLTQLELQLAIQRELQNIRQRDA